MDFFERLSQGGDWKLFVIHKTIEWVFEKLCHAAASGEDIRLNIPDVAFMPRDGPVRRLKKNLRNKTFRVHRGMRETILYHNPTKVKKRVKIIH